MVCVQQYDETMRDFASTITPSDQRGRFSNRNNSSITPQQRVARRRTRHVFLAALRQELPDANTFSHLSGTVSLLAVEISRFTNRVVYDHIVHACMVHIIDDSPMVFTLFQQSVEVESPCRWTHYCRLIHQACSNILRVRTASAYCFGFIKVCLIRPLQRGTNHFLFF